MYRTKEPTNQQTHVILAGSVTKPNFGCQSSNSVKAISSENNHSFVWYSYRWEAEIQEGHDVAGKPRDAAVNILWWQYRALRIASGGKKSPGDRNSTNGKRMIFFTRVLYRVRQWGLAVGCTAAASTRDQPASTGWTNRTRSWTGGRSGRIRLHNIPATAGCSRDRHDGKSKPKVVGHYEPSQRGAFRSLYRRLGQQWTAARR